MAARPRADTELFSMGGPGPDESSEGDVDHESHGSTSGETTVDDMGYQDGAMGEQCGMVISYCEPIAPTAIPFIHRIPPSGAVNPNLGRFEVLLSINSINPFRKARKRRTIETNVRLVRFAIVAEGRKRKDLKGDEIWRIDRDPEDSHKLYITFADSKPVHSLICDSAAYRERLYSTLWAMHFDMGSRVGQLTVPVTVWVGTWNVGNKKPPDSLSLYLPRDEYDIYCLAVQECRYTFKDENGKKISCLTRDAWYDYVEAALGPNYKVIAKKSLWDIRVVTAVRRRHFDKISAVQCGMVATGIGNVAGNKGGVCLTFKFLESQFCFIGSHLAAHQGKILRRNQNYSAIIKGLQGMGPKLFDITNTADYVFWCGDLNYRIDLDRNDCLGHISRQNWEVLFQADQLQQQMRRNHAFVGFAEGKIDFPPSYRYNRGSREYSIEKMRVPSYCDRVLWRCNPNHSATLNSYGCHQGVMTSDHSPVSATFSCTAQIPYIPREWDVPAPPCFIVLRGVKARLFLERQPLHLAFAANFLPDNRYRSGASTRGQTPEWRDDVIPELPPFNGDHDYLFATVLHVALIENGSSVGEGNIELRVALDGSGGAFDIPLMKFGLGTGHLSGCVVIQDAGGVHATSLAAAAPAVSPPLGVTIHRDYDAGAPVDIMSQPTEIQLEDISMAPL